MGGGRHVLGISKAIRAAIGKDVGDRVKVVLERDTEPRTVTAPPDLETALKRVPAARRAFDGLSYTHRKEYVRWIEEAKKPPTRERRVQQTLERLVEGKAIVTTPGIGR